MLQTAKPHVLIILDCCFAANAARDTTEGASKEILAACGRENLTLGVGIRSFTSVLIDELKEFMRMPFTVAMLHSSLVTMRWRLAFTPFYTALSEHRSNSITICPLPEAPTSVAYELECPTKFGPDQSVGGVTTEVATNYTMDMSSPCPSQAHDHDTRVLLSISVAEEVGHNIQQWVSWLTTAAPWDVSKVNVRVESMFKSHSTLVLVSVPIIGWNRLSQIAAYRFIGFIKSDDLLCESKCRPEPDMTIRSQLKRSHEVPAEREPAKYCATRKLLNEAPK